MKLALGLQLGRSRRLPTSYTGVRDWWRPRAGITLATGVSSWAAQGSGRTLTQGTTANQPAYATDASFGAASVLSFDGTNDRLVGGTASDWRLLHDGTGCTLVFVYKATNVAAERVIFDTSNFSSTAAGITITHDSVNQRMRFVAGGGVTNTIALTATANSSAPNATKLVATYRYKEGRAGNEFDFRIGGASAASGNSANAPGVGDPVGALSVGGRTAGTTLFSGLLAGVVVATDYLDDATVTAIENFLSADSS